jgi:hypothetical protein
MKILLACEESQIVTKEFRKMGHEAFSCDIIECSGENPEWHIIDDVINQLDKGWDMMIAFPPCTHLTRGCGHLWHIKKEDGRQGEAIDFFMKLANAPINKIAIENPIGIMSSEWRKPDQIIQPYYFGDDAMKFTCLWLKNLPKLVHIKQNDLFENQTWIEPTYVTTRNNTTYNKWFVETGRITTKNGLRAKIRSKTFKGIANAMAKQWG